MLGLYVLGGCLVLWLGFVLGVWSADYNWLITGRQSGRYGRTPHHCGGKFFYVIPEDAFCREYVHRVDVAAAEEVGGGRDPAESGYPGRPAPVAVPGGPDPE